MTAPAAPDTPLSSELWAEAAEARVLDAAVALAPRLGWGSRLVARAAEEAGLSAADAMLLLPAGPRDLAALLSRRHDAAALAALAEVDPLGLKVRERIRRAVEARVEAAAADEAAVKRCTAFLARPTNLKLGLSLLWESADVLWRWAGDVATDENHYTKRVILSGVLASTVAVRFERGAAAAAEHLDARIANVMAFEKWKAGLPKAAGTLTAVAAALARRRYGASEPELSPEVPIAAATD
jgi:ubiquinone biosynthesis protein COQ9